MEISAITILSIREKLSNYMQVAGDKKVKVLYKILKDEIEKYECTTIKKYNKEINKAEKEFKKGKFISQKKMGKIASKWSYKIELFFELYETSNCFKTLLSIITLCSISHIHTKQNNKQANKLFPPSIKYYGHYFSKR
jgi:hypothetical protein